MILPINGSNDYEWYWGVSPNLTDTMNSLHPCRRHINSFDMWIFNIWHAWKLTHMLIYKIMKYILQIGRCTKYQTLFFNTSGRSNINFLRFLINKICHILMTVMALQFHFQPLRPLTTLLHKAPTPITAYNVSVTILRFVTVGGLSEAQRPQIIANLYRSHRKWQPFSGYAYK